MTNSTTSEPRAVILSGREMERYQQLRDAVIETAKEYKRLSYTRTRLSRLSKVVLMQAVGDLCAFERHFHLDETED